MMYHRRLALLVHKGVVLGSSNFGFDRYVRIFDACGKAYRGGGGGFSCRWDADELHGFSRPVRFGFAGLRFRGRGKGLGDQYGALYLARP